MCELYGFCGNQQVNLNKYTDIFWKHAAIHKDGFGYYLADNDELYVNPRPATFYLNDLAKKGFDSSLALCHIRFKTHGDVSEYNCHPFSKLDGRDIKWTLIHNGYIIDYDEDLERLSSVQIGDTDSERILLFLIEEINFFYNSLPEMSCNNQEEFLNYLYFSIEEVCNHLSRLGKTNLIFTDSFTQNMYVYINHPKSLFYLRTGEGVHFSSTRLTEEDWESPEPYKLLVFNKGKRIY